MPQGSFSGQVSAWVAQTKQRMKAVRDEGAQRVIEAMQVPVGAGGNMPVRSGFLRASLMATIGEPNFTVRSNPSPEGSFAYEPGAVSLVIAGAKLEDTITAVYTAIYARVANYGGENRQARLFVNLAAQQWPAIVDEVSREAQGRAGT